MPSPRIHTSSAAPAPAVAASARPTPFEGCHRVSARKLPMSSTAPARVTCAPRPPTSCSQSSDQAPATSRYAHSRIVPGRETSSSPASGPNTKTGGARST